MGFEAGQDMACKAWTATLGPFRETAHSQVYGRGGGRSEQQADRPRSPWLGDFVHFDGDMLRLDGRAIEPFLRACGMKPRRWRPTRKIAQAFAAAAKCHVSPSGRSFWGVVDSQDEDLCSNFDFGAGAGQVLTAIGAASALVELDPSGKIVVANQGFWKDLGYDLAEIKGKHHDMFVEPGSALSSQTLRVLGQAPPRREQCRRIQAHWQGRQGNVASCFLHPGHRPVGKAGESRHDRDGRGSWWQKQRRWRTKPKSTRFPGVSPFFGFFPRWDDSPRPTRRCSNCQATGSRKFEVARTAFSSIRLTLRAKPTASSGANSVAAKGSTEEYKRVGKGGKEVGILSRLQSDRRPGRPGRQSRQFHELHHRARRVRRTDRRRLRPPRQRRSAAAHRDAVGARPGKIPLATG